MDDQTLELYIQSCYTNFKLRWSAEKDAKLRRERGVSFIDLLGARVIHTKDHPRKLHQRVIFVDYREHIWVIPYVNCDGEIFLKTAYPSRAHTKMWKGGWLL